MLLERCCITAEEVSCARINGAGRVELCRNLSVGGITPEREEIVKAVATGMKVNVLVRPRGGDFVYSEAEICEMMDDIDFCQKSGANGVVIGALTREGDIDVKSMQRLMEHAKGLEVTFHRAFDQCSDPFRALEQIIDLGCRTLLTSGQAATAIEGTELISQLVRKADGRIVIMPGCGVTPDNLNQIAEDTGTCEFHGTKLCKAQQNY